MSVESELRAKIRPAEPTGAERSAISMVRAAMNIEDTLRDALRTMVAAANTYGTVALSADINNFVAGGAAWHFIYFDRLCNSGQVSYYHSSN